MGITNVLCQALQSHSQDTLNDVHLVSTTKSLLRNDGWFDFLENVKDFCKREKEKKSKKEIEIPNMSIQYKIGRGHSCQPNVIVEHHY